MRPRGCFLLWLLRTHPRWLTALRKPCGPQPLAAGRRKAVGTRGVCEVGACARPRGCRSPSPTAQPGYALCQLSPMHSGTNAPPKPEPLLTGVLYSPLPCLAPPAARRTHLCTRGQSHTRRRFARQNRCSPARRSSFFLPAAQCFPPMGAPLPRSGLCPLSPCPCPRRMLATRPGQHADCTLSGRPALPTLPASWQTGRAPARHHLFCTCTLSGLVAPPYAAVRACSRLCGAPPITHDPPPRPPSTRC
jgi:hypothetical protein